MWNWHQGSEYKGYYWGVGYDGPSDPTKQAYGHAFVLGIHSHYQCTTLKGCIAKTYKPNGRTLAAAP